MLEQQQAQLVAGLRELYSRLQNGQGWPGEPLREAQGGHPLTHDILERLDLLHSSESSESYEPFEENPARLQQRLLDAGATMTTRRRGSISSESDHGHTSSSSTHGTPPLKSIPFSDPFARRAAPITPPSDSPLSRTAQLHPIKLEQLAQQPPLFTQSPLSRDALNPQSAMRNPGWSMDTPISAEDPMLTAALFDGSMYDMNMDPIYMTNWADQSIAFDSFVDPMEV
jgi:hypothetical protein